jgi:hypothetical protein
MKTLITGSVAFGLIIWPIIAFKYWTNQNAAATLYPSLLSWLIGSILAICGTMIYGQKSSTLRLFGQILCVSTLCVEGVIILYFVVEIVSHFPQSGAFGVN